MTAPLGLTLGDPSGIGPEITVAAWQAGVPPFVVIGCAATLQSAAGNLVEVIPVGAPDAAAEAFARGLPVLDRPCPAPVTAGRPDPANAPSVVDWIETGVELCRAGTVSALVTNPINKKVLQDGADFAHPGHTEFLAALTGAKRPIMLLTGPELRVVPVTIHIALADVPAALTETLLEETLRGTIDGLREDFGIDTPRVAVAGLNPHAGEGGKMGWEEERMIAPLLERLRAEGLALTGPLPADTMFHPAARAEYDVAVCMYHDQALVPIKTLSFDDGVNVTLGLPIIRTSPDHGTAYGIAGRGLARSNSLIAALREADRMVGARRG